MACIPDPSGALRLLGSMYLCSPSREALAGWMSLLADDACGFLKELTGALNGIEAGSDVILEDLQWDYARLFIGPYKLPCPPWESVYTSQGKLMMQNAADDARRAYAEFGLAVGDLSVMPDHIGAELNFLALVYERSHEDLEGPSEYIRVGDAFLDDHLMKWVPQFTADMELAAETPLYKALARTTRKTLDLLSA